MVDIVSEGPLNVAVKSDSVVTQDPNKAVAKVARRRGEYLKTGKCDSCRAHKKRCDGARPCRRCVEIRREDSCTYHVQATIDLERAAKEERRKKSRQKTKAGSRSDSDDIGSRTGQTVTIFQLYQEATDLDSSLALSYTRCHYFSKFYKHTAWHMGFMMTPTQDFIERVHDGLADPLSDICRDIETRSTVQIMCALGSRSLGHAVASESMAARASLGLCSSGSSFSTMFGLALSGLYWSADMPARAKEFFKTAMMCASCISDDDDVPAVAYLSGLVNIMALSEDHEIVAAEKCELYHSNPAIADVAREQEIFRMVEEPGAVFEPAAACGMFYEVSMLSMPLVMNILEATGQQCLWPVQGRVNTTVAMVFPELGQTLTLGMASLTSGPCDQERTQALYDYSLRMRSALELLAAAAEAVIPVSVRDNVLSTLEAYQVAMLSSLIPLDSPLLRQTAAVSLERMQGVDFGMAHPGALLAPALLLNYMIHAQDTAGMATLSGYLSMIDRQSAYPDARRTAMVMIIEGILCEAKELETDGLVGNAVYESAQSVDIGEQSLLVPTGANLPSAEGALVNIVTSSCDDEYLPPVTNVM